NESLRASAIYVPGEVLFGFHPEERIRNGGYAVMIEEKGSVAVRPVAHNFMTENYRYEVNDAPVSPPMKVNLAFVTGHDLRDFSFPFAAFLNRIHKINEAVWGLKPDFRANAPAQP